MGAPLRELDPKHYDPSHPDFSLRLLYHGSVVHVTEWDGGMPRERSYSFTYIGDKGADIMRNDWRDRKRLKWEAINAYFDPNGPAQRKIVRVTPPSVLPKQQRPAPGRRRRGVSNDDPRCKHLGPPSMMRVMERDLQRFKVIEEKLGFEFHHELFKYLIDHYEKTKHLAEPPASSTKSPQSVSG